MTRNTDRRDSLADAGISVIAASGARGLTHRAVDRAAGVPTGTTSNYFASRDDLIGALVDRIGERLTPNPDDVASAADRRPDRALVADLVRDVARRLTKEPDVALALFELRLEAHRRPAVAATLGAWRQRAFEEDVRFHESLGLSGGRTEIALLHHAIDGLLLDRLTIPMHTGLSTEDAVTALVERILPAALD